MSPGKRKREPGAPLVHWGVVSKTPCFARHRVAVQVLFIEPAHAVDVSLSDHAGSEDSNAPTPSRIRGAFRASRR